MIHTIIVFTPILLGLGVLSALKGQWIKQSIIAVPVLYVLYYTLYIVTGWGEWWLPAVQFVTASLLTILLLGSFGAKISRPTYLTVLMMFMLFPISLETVVSFFIAFVSSVIFATLVGMYKLRKYEKITKTPKREFTQLVADTSLDLGILTHQLPTGRHMPDLDEVNDSLKTRMAPAYFAGTILGMVMTLV